MRLLKKGYRTILAVLFFALPTIAIAQNIIIKESTSNKSLSIPNVNLVANIDGELDDEIWQQALSIDLNLVNSPWDNLPSPVKTQAKMVENGDFLYISFRAFDDEPEKVLAMLGDRDSRWNDELVGIKLDTVNNRRLNYSFLVNPLGVQHDEIFNEMTGESNRSWDGIWQSYGKITDKGYQVEIAIPFHILNFEQIDGEKTWAFELIRIYRRDKVLRISHVALDKNNACWLCQYPEIKGFKSAKADKNITLIPSFVASKNQSKDVYTDNANWNNDSETEAGLDLRWGINSNTLLNLTLNPDFSTVESDAGQLKVNKTYSLFYEEKRAFFLENADYFSSNFNLVYTRNIADPDYGAKLTGTQGKHSYGFFATNDTQTNFILPGNTGSSLKSLDEESHSSALKYRYDFSDDLSVGVINTIRTSDNYHNIVAGLDTKYRFDDTNSILFQVVNSDTKTPTLGNDSTSNSDIAYKIDLIHQSEYWLYSAKHQQIGKDFRADLGFMTKADYQQEKLEVKRSFYGDMDTSWSEASIAADWTIEHNEADELLQRSLSSKMTVSGPMLSYVELSVEHSDKIGLPQLPFQENDQHDDQQKSQVSLADRFVEDQFKLYGSIQPINNFSAQGEIIFGDKIDYANNRLGDYKELWSNFTYNFNKHLAFDISYTHSELEADDQEVYTEQLTDLRINYQFDVRSYLKLSVVYSNTQFNPNNNPNDFYSEDNKNISTQLIYAYKINPQTVFFVGYSDNSYQDDDLKHIEQAERTFFTKISYAWMP
jgi:hypothetical protein